VFSGEAGQITDVERAFLEPANVTHRQYEALRAYFVDKVPSKEAAARFGYSSGSFRVLCHDFRSDPGRAFFLPDGRRAANSEKAPSKTARLRDKVVALRKANLSVYDISLCSPRTASPCHRRRSGDLVRGGLCPPAAAGR